MELIEKVREFILVNFLFDNKAEISNTDSLMENGIIDSTGILEVVSFLEEDFEIEVEDDELTPEHLDSIKSIAEYIVIKQTEKENKSRSYGNMTPWKES